MMRVVKFGLVGLLNTAIGFAVIVAALSAGLNDYTANFVGYAVGLVISYSLNRSWTFSSGRQPSFREISAYLGVFGVAYCANLVVLTSFRTFGFVQHPLAHLLGLAVYSVIFYILSRHIVFGSHGPGFRATPQSISQLRSAFRQLQSSASKLIDQHFSFLLAVSATFVVLLLFAGQNIPIVIWDEGRIIINAMEMRQSGLSLVTTYNFQPDLWNTKPPLLVWLMTGSIALFGPTELALRLPSLIAALGTILLVMLFLRRITHSVAIATFGGLVLAMSAGFFGEHGARTADYDALLVFFTTGCLTTLFFAVHQEKVRLSTLSLAALFGAAALMTKSVAGGAPLVGVLVYIMLLGRWRRILTTPRYVAAGLLALAPLGAFLILREYMAPGYLDAFIFNDVTGRFNEALDNHSGPPWYYLQATFVVGMFSLGIATFLAPFALTVATGKSRYALSYALCVAAGLLVVVSASETKLSHYYLPAYPFLAIAAALAVHTCLNHFKGQADSGALTSRCAAIMRAAPVLLLLIAMAQSVNIRVNVLDPRLDYPGARYGMLLDFLSTKDAPIWVIDAGKTIPNEAHFAPELRFHMMVARENGRDIQQQYDASRLASVSRGTIVATCDLAFSAVVRSAFADQLFDQKGCVAARNP